MRWRDLDGSDALDRFHDEVKDGWARSHAHARAIASRRVSMHYAATRGRSPTAAELVLHRLSFLSDQPPEVQAEVARLRAEGWTSPVDAWGGMDR